MATRGARTVRGLVASLFAVFVAAFAHSIGGGGMPGIAGIGFAVAFSSLASVALAGRRVSPVRLAASVILSQGLFHVVFLLSGGTATTAALGPGMHMTAAPMVVTPGAGMAEDPWMWLAHATAAVVTIVALVWGEKAFWGLFELVLRAGRALAVQAIRATRPRAPIGSPRSFAARFMPGDVRHRGPPQLAASC